MLDAEKLKGYYIQITASAEDSAIKGVIRATAERFHKNSPLKSDLENWYAAEKLLALWCHNQTFLNPSQMGSLESEFFYTLQHRANDIRSNDLDLGLGEQHKDNNWYRAQKEKGKEIETFLRFNREMFKDAERILSYQDKK